MPDPLAVPGVDAPAPRRVLVVDDDAAFAEVAREFLALDGYEVHVCIDSALALARARALRPALLLLDVRMPGVDGLALLGRLRRDPRTAAIPALLCSAVAPPEQAVWRELLGARGVPILFKPFRFDELLARVRALLAGRAPTSAGREPRGAPPPVP